MKETKRTNEPLLNHYSSLPQIQLTSRQETSNRDNNPYESLSSRFKNQSHLNKYSSPTLKTSDRRQLSSSTRKQRLEPIQKQEGAVAAIQNHRMNRILQSAMTNQSNTNNQIAALILFENSNSKA